jgi:uncharacterized protein
MKISSKGTALITGASTGIGAIYADRFARRGHDLILVARNRERLDAVATRIRAETDSCIEVIVADLSEQVDLARVAEVLRTDPTITVLVNNAGIGAPASLIDSDISTLRRMIDLNVSAVVHLTHSVLPAFVERRGGSIISIGSIVGIAPEILNSVYGASKAFVLAFSISLQKQFADRSIRVQAVLPGATATDFWDLAGTPLAELPEEIVMRADDMVDAALAGFDQGELVTIPALADVADWHAYESARQNLLPKLSRRTPAARYGAANR